MCFLQRRVAIHKGAIHQQHLQCTRHLSHVSVFCDDCVALGLFPQCLRRAFVVESFSKPREFENYMGEFGMCGGYNPNRGGTPEVLFSCGTEAQCLAGLVFSTWMNSFGKTGQNIHKYVFLDMAWLRNAHKTPWWTVCQVRFPI